MNKKEAVAQLEEIRQQLEQDGAEELYLRNILSTLVGCADDPYWLRELTRRTAELSREIIDSRRALTN